MGDIIYGWLLTYTWSVKWIATICYTTTYLMCIFFADFSSIDLFFIVVVEFECWIKNVFQTFLQKSSWNWSVALPENILWNFFHLIYNTVSVPIWNCLHLVLNCIKICCIFGIQKHNVLLDCIFFYFFFLLLPIRPTSSQMSTFNF